MKTAQSFVTQFRGKRAELESLFNEQRGLMSAEQISICEEAIEVLKAEETEATRGLHKIEYLSGDYPHAALFAILTDATANERYRTLAEFALKNWRRNRIADRISDLLRQFRAEAESQVQPDAKTFNRTKAAGNTYAVRLNIALIDEAWRLFQDRPAAVETKICGFAGCQNRIPVADAMCGRCRHDEE